MSILVDEDTKVLVQGVTGKEGSFHTKQMLEYGTQIVCGVTPGKGGTTLERIPVYDSVEEAVENHTIDASVIFVPARFASDAILEAADSGIGLVICIAEGIPVHEMLKTYWMVKSRNATLIGPNCPGVISPGKAKLGIMPGEIFSPGRVGVVSRSGTLTYEIASGLSEAGFGQSTVVGIGGDPVIGSCFVDILGLFEEDEETKLIVLVGEIGGSAEEEAAQFIAKNMDTPVISYIAGFSAPLGKRMGHAGAIISGSDQTASAKADQLEKRGIPVGKTPQAMAKLASKFY